MPAFNIDINAPFEEQLEYFRSKGHLINPEGWEAIQAGTHARAFTIARVAAMDIIVDVKEALAASIAAGETVEQFIKSLPDIMERKGWLGANMKSRLTTIFRTNLADAYNVGRFKQQTDVMEARPYWQYDAINDGKTRIAHRRMDNRVFRADDPIWRTWYPPNGFNCRCVVKTLSERQAAKMGATIQDKVPVYDGKALTPDKGWDYNVGEKGLEAYSPELAKYTSLEKKLLTESLRKIT